jgi:hypothetical protein
MAGLESYGSYILKLFSPPVGWRDLVKGSHDLYILPLTLRAPDPILPWFKVAVFHHLVAVGATAGERIDNDLHASRHDDLIEDSFHNIPYVLCG